METYYILDASAFINGFHIKNINNYTVPETAEEVKDFKSKLALEQSIEEGKVKIRSPGKDFSDKVEDIISKSGDSLRLSLPDKKLIALALMIYENHKKMVVITDDYSIQNVLKILNMPYKSIMTEGIKEVYNWKKVCKGCKKEFPQDYEFDDCEICGSDLFKKRIKK
ncbi:ribonuclease VapC [Methanobrevibacter sp. OttesenSCG-928-K11]|nr:ribonuclease VapC [Methanobrevibacter sp. OttesenSCG-928-K11]